MSPDAGRRVVADHQLSRPDFEDLARQLAMRPIRARKIGVVAARQASVPERVETKWNGQETTNVAQPGDWIVTNMSADRQPLRDRDGNLNVYAIRASRFPELYERATGLSPFGVIYRPTTTVRALLLADGFDILAPWGERQVAAAGYLIANGDDVYGNNAETFAATYEILPGD